MKNKEAFSNQNMMFLSIWKVIIGDSRSSSPYLMCWQSHFYTKQLFWSTNHCNKSGWKLGSRSEPGNTGRDLKHSKSNFQWSKLLCLVRYRCCCFWPDSGSIYSSVGRCCSKKSYSHSRHRCSRSGMGLIRGIHFHCLSSWIDSPRIIRFNTWRVG